MTDTQPRTKTVLVIEDNAIARDGVAAALLRHGYEAITTADGGTALQLLADGTSPDVIILDMFLPFVDGWRFLDRFRASEQGSTPVIVTTGTDLSREWAAENGCAGILHKPFDEEDLIAEVRRALRHV